MDESAANFNIFSLTGDTECVIKVQGDIDLRALPRLRGALRYAISGRPGRLIVDLTEASSVDVEGLAVLAAAYDRAKSVGTPCCSRRRTPPPWICSKNPVSTWCCPSFLISCPSSGCPIRASAPIHGDRSRRGSAAS
jgi:anti-anti-sigma factor